VLLLVNPEGSSRVLIIVWGVLAILGGAFQFFFSFRMRKFGKKGGEGLEIVMRFYFNKTHQNSKNLGGTICNDSIDSFL